MGLNGKLRISFFSNLPLKSFLFYFAQIPNSNKILVAAHFWTSDYFVNLNFEKVISKIYLHDLYFLSLEFLEMRNQKVWKQKLSFSRFACVYNLIKLYYMKVF